MRIHLTCSNPQRKLVIAMHAARTLLSQAGHRVSVSWPERWEDGSGTPQLGFNRAALAAADVIVHASLTGEALPRELADAAAAGRPVVHYAPGPPVEAESKPDVVLSARDVVDAVAGACASKVG